jgi:hypothetical protein
MQFQLRAFCCIASLACTLSAQAAPPDTDFRRAIASYQAARYSEAFGRLMALANRGDPDAARIVLFMNQYGPTLYGSYWDLNPDEVLQFQQVAMLATRRAPPPFQPTVVPQSVSTRKAAASAGTAPARNRKP